MKKNDDVNVHQLANDIDENLKVKYDNEFQEKIKEYNSNIESLNDKKKHLESKLVALSNQFDSSTLNNGLDPEVQGEIKIYITEIEESQQEKKGLESKLQGEHKQFELIQQINKREVSSLE